MKLNARHFTIAIILIVLFFILSSFRSRPDNNANSVIDSCLDDKSNFTSLCATDNLLGFSREPACFGGHCGPGFDGSVFISKESINISNYAAQYSKIDQKPSESIKSLNMNGNAIITEAATYQSLPILENGYIPFGGIVVVGADSIQENNCLESEQKLDSVQNIQTNNMVINDNTYILADKSIFKKNFIDTPFIEITGKKIQFLNNTLLFRNIAKSNTDLSNKIIQQSSLLSQYQGDIGTFDYYAESAQSLYDFRQLRMKLLTLIKNARDNKLNKAEQVIHDIEFPGNGEGYIRDIDTGYRYYESDVIEELEQSNLPTTALLVTCAPNTVIDGNTFTAKVKNKSKNSDYAIVLKNSPNVRITNNTFNGFDVPILMDSNSSIIDDSGNVINPNKVAGANATFDKTGNLTTTDQVNYGKPEDYYPKSLWQRIFD